jgi:[ribosomal protein S18]-alanine N-acetyltransferase
MPKNTGTIEIKKLQDKHKGEVCAQMMADSEPWITLGRGYDVLLKAVMSSSREVYFAALKDEIAGFIMINMHGTFVGYVQSICVAPDWRNKGVGGQLMAFAENRIFSETPNVFLCVSSFNKGAQRLYEKLGYEVVGELKDFIASGYSEILMRKTISPLAEFKMFNRPARRSGPVESNRNQHDD